MTLECKDCKRRNYHTNKNKRTTPDKLEFNKYCKWCHRAPLTKKPSNLGIQTRSTAGIVRTTECGS